MRAYVYRFEFRREHSTVHLRSVETNQGQQYHKGNRFITVCVGRVLSLDLPHRLQEGLLPLVSKLDAKKVQLGKLDAQVKVILKRVTLFAIKGAGKGPGIRGG